MGVRSLHQSVRVPLAWVLSGSTDPAVSTSDLQLLLYDGQTGDLYQVGAEATSDMDPETGTSSGVTVCSLLPLYAYKYALCQREFIKKKELSPSHPY
jgi:hypothetical protein